MSINKIFLFILIISLVSPGFAQEDTTAFADSAGIRQPDAAQVPNCDQRISAAIDSLSEVWKQKEADLVDSLRTFWGTEYREKRDSISRAYTEKLSTVRENLNTYYESKATALNSEFQMRLQTVVDSVMRAQEQLFAEQTGGIDQEEESRAYQYLTLVFEAKPREKGFFTKLIGGKDEDLPQFKITKAKEYLDRFKPYGHSAEVQANVVDLLLKQEKWEDATAEGLRMVCLYPDSSQTQDIRDRASAAVKDRGIFEERQDILLTLLDSVVIKEGIEDRDFMFLSFLNIADVSTWNTLRKNAQARFLREYPTGNYSDQVILWEADRLRGEESFQRSILTLQKIIIEYPHSDILPVVYYTIAEIYDKNFEEFKNAIGKYQEYLSKFPNHTRAVNAQYRIAKIYDIKLASWPDAVRSYESVQANHPNSSKAIESLLRKGDIQYSQLKDVNGAISTYESVLEFYTDSTNAAATALMRMGSMYNREKRYNEAVETYLRIETEYPESEQLLSAYQEIAEIQESKLDNKQAAIETLEKIVERFPESSEATSARKKIEKLSK